MNAKKRALLVNIVRKLDAKGNYPPLSTAFLKAYADTFEHIRERCEISLYTASFDGFDPVDLAQRVRKDAPCLIGFSCYTWNLKQYLDTLPDLRRAAPRAVIALGGPEAHPGLLHIAPEIDAIVIGEGEIPFKHLLESLLNDQPWREIPGTACKDDNGRVLKNPPQKLLKNLDDIPSPYRLGILPETPIRHIEYSRGCTNKCSYCVDANEPYRHVSIERMEQEILDCIHSGAQLGLTAGAYLNFREFGTQVLRIIKKHREAGKQISIADTLCIDANNDDEEFFNLLDEIVPDKSQLALTVGIQCTHPTPLKLNRRVTKMKRVSNVFTKWNFCNLAQLIIGLPGDNIFRIAHTIAESVKLKPQLLQTFPMLIIPNTHLFENKEKFHIISDDMPPHEPEHIGDQDFSTIRKFQMMAYSAAMEYNVSRHLK